MAKPGPQTVRYGGNTACVEVRADDGTLVVLDCGTGAHALGQSLMASGQGPLRGHLLITHTHWDHIQGFPFFAPLFVPGNEWDIYAPGAIGQRLEETLAGQMEFTYFPVTLAEMGATIRFHDLTEGVFQAGGIHVTGRYLNHPAVVMGFRLEADGATVVYATDHEPHAASFPELAENGEAGEHTARGARHASNGKSAQEQRLPVHQEDRRHVEFLRGADLVIHDAQYTLEEYPNKRGWGHTPMELATDFAALAAAERLALFHHDPTRTDEALDPLVVRCRQRPLALETDMSVFAAAESMEIDLGRRRRRRPIQPLAGAAELEGGAFRPGEETILVAEDDPDILALLGDILEPEGFRVLLASDGDAALNVARAVRPSLVLMDWAMPGRTGLDVLKALRASEEPALRDMPVVLLTARDRAEDTAAGFAAGATDYLTKPFSTANVRARVREWVLRARAGRAAADSAAGGATRAGTLKT
ncbi:MAG: hypothetical protein AVDCRST_MAG77-1990 [uncultured Chloroflexi bacterium]|uniref:Response regulatory domain-containing protein n=1 Tax=uncultured Chloroflexota bacterium TaxID=166587 RepID=A0A6J4H310_9CHLR|nr:MAG: hypothetical protein AVDCRST_MAG77-1990 [uncultured Chloroflexota bacterium]